MVQSELEELWNDHRDFLKRLLIGLGRDVDLAEDLLQETFILASKGLSGYRGGDGRAWLAAIAKNAFYSHSRRHYVSRETELTPESITGACENVSLTSLEIRDAISQLPQTMRTALITRHYGGYSYEEIAQRAGCPVGTAKSRVCLALKRLRSALSPEWEDLRMLCDEITDRTLMDYALGKSRNSKAIKTHMRSCNACARRADEVMRVLHALDQVEAAYKISTILEVERDGSLVEYISMSMPVPTDKPMDRFEFGAGTVPAYVAVQGEAVAAEPTGETTENSWAKFCAELPKTVQPDETLDLFFVNRPKEQKIGMQPDGVWHLGPGTLNLTEDLAYSVSVRLPDGAALVAARPEADLMNADGATTVYWQGVLPANQPFEFWVDYRLEE